jgi:hypothetical protein
VQRDVSRCPAFVQRGGVFFGKSNLPIKLSSGETLYAVSACHVIHTGLEASYTEVKSEPTGTLLLLEVSVQGYALLCPLPYVLSHSLTPRLLHNRCPHSQLMSLDKLCESLGVDTVPKLFIPIRGNGLWCARCCMLSCDMSCWVRQTELPLAHRSDKVPVCISADALATLSSEYADVHNLCDAITAAVAQSCNNNNFRLFKVQAMLNVRSHPPARCAAQQRARCVRTSMCLVPY